MTVPFDSSFEMQDPAAVPKATAAQPRSFRPKSQRHWPVEYDPPANEIIVGVVVPFDFALDWEYWRYLPPRVILHFTRTPFLRLPVGVPLSRAVGRPSVVARATRTLLAVNPAAVLYACTSGSFVDGVAHDERIRAAMAAAGARNPVTTSSAMLDGFRATGIKKIALATPYTDTLTRRLCTFLEEGGIEIVSCHYLGLSENMAKVSKSTIASLTRGLDTTKADAVFVSCTSLRTYGIVNDLEAEMGRPVFTSNQVSLWRALVAAGALPRPKRAPSPRWTMGGPPPIALSTRLLMDASATVRSWDLPVGPSSPEMHQRELSLG